MVAVHRLTSVRPVLLIVGTFALIATLLAWSRWLAGRRWAAAGHLLLAAVAALGVSLAWPLVGYVDTFERWVPTRPVAELFFERIGPDRYRVALTRLPNGLMQVVELTGDQWRIDLQTLDWPGGAADLGLEPRCRIDRLTSQAATPAEPGELSGPTHELADRSVPAPSFATTRLGGRPPLVTARELVGPWQPMVHGARFGVRLSAERQVVVEALNATAGDGAAPP